MKNTKLLFLGGLFIFSALTFVSLLNNRTPEPVQAQVAGDFLVELRSEVANLPLSGATVTADCPASAGSVVLNENPPSSGNYFNSLNAACNNGDAIDIDIVLDGFVDRANLAAGNWDQAQAPDCLGPTNCLVANNHQFGLRFDATDSGTANPIGAVNVSPENSSCQELQAGSYYCNEPLQVGCPSTSNFTATASGYQTVNDIYNDRCNGNDPQEVVNLVMTQAGGGGGGGPGNTIFNEQEELIDSPTPVCEEAIAFGNNRFEVVTNLPDVSLVDSFQLFGNNQLVGEVSIDDVDIAFGNDRFSIAFSNTNSQLIKDGEALELCTVSGNKQSCGMCPGLAFGDSGPYSIVEPTPTNFGTPSQGECPFLGMHSGLNGQDLFDSIADISLDFGSGSSRLQLPAVTDTATPRREGMTILNDDGTTSLLTIDIPSPNVRDNGFIASEIIFFSGSTAETTVVLQPNNNSWVPWTAVDTITTNNSSTTTEHFFDPFGNRNLVKINGQVVDPSNWPSEPKNLLGLFLDVQNTCTVNSSFVPDSPPAPPAVSDEAPGFFFNEVDKKGNVECGNTPASPETEIDLSLLLDEIANPALLTPEILKFLSCTESTALLDLGLGERISVLNSYFEAYAHLPRFPEDFFNLNLIALGSTPKTPAAQKVDEAKATFADLFGRQPDMDDPRDKTTVDRLAYGIRPTNRDLNKERVAIGNFFNQFGRVPESHRDWNTVRALAYHDEKSDLRPALDVIAEGNALLEEGKDPCPPEYVAKLEAEKARLEGEAKALQDAQTMCKDTLKDMGDDIKDINKKINDEQKKADDAGKESKALDKEIADADQAVKDIEGEIKDLQQILAGGDGVSTHTGDKPLGGVGSGAAVTFDGGKTWIVAEGEAGVEQLTENLENNPDIVGDLNDLKSDLSNAKKNKADKEKEKAKKEQEKKDAEKKKSEHEKEKSAKETQKKDKQDEFDATGQKIDDLNALIDEFNAIAAECNVRATNASRAASDRLDDAKDKLDNMPDDVKEDAEEIFDQTATEEEKNASTDGGYAGGVADSAAKKLEDAMRAASSCPEGHRKCGGESSTREYINSGWEGWFETMLYLRGSGLEGDKKYAEMIDDLNDGFDAVDKIDKLGVGIGLAADTLAGGSALAGFGLQIPGLAYGVWQDIAKGAAINKIKEIRNVLPNPAIEGHRHLYGGWDKYKKRTFTDVAVCKDGIYQKAAATLTRIEVQCELADAFKSIKIPDENLPDYREKEDGNWANPGQLQKYRDWSKKFFEDYGPFEECKESISEFSPDCS